MCVLSWRNSADVLRYPPPPPPPLVILLTNLHTYVLSRSNSGAESLGLDFTVTLESFGVKDVAELLPGGKDVAVTDENKEKYLQVSERGGGGGQRGFARNHCGKGKQGLYGMLLFVRFAQGGSEISAT